LYCVATALHLNIKYYKVGRNLADNNMNRDKIRLIRISAVFF